MLLHIIRVKFTKAGPILRNLQDELRQFTLVCDEMRLKVRYCFTSPKKWKIYRRNGVRG